MIKEKLLSIILYAIGFIAVIFGAVELERLTDYSVAQCVLIMILGATIVLGTEILKIKNELKKTKGSPDKHR